VTATGHGGHALRHALAAVVAATAVACALLLPAIRASAAKPASTSAAAYLAAAEYYGDGNPINMWSSDLSGAPEAFARMKEDGFNTVGLVVPWGEFQTGLTPPKYDEESFRRLDQLVTDASKLGMGVILRLSYEWDTDPADQMPDGARFDALWSNQNVYTAWLGYIAAVHRDVARFHNVREAYISWEDLWEPVTEAQAATTSSQQLALATSTGYRAWLRAHDSLATVSGDYGAKFATWAQVPTPPADQPSFRLMYQYEDSALVHRLFLPAARRFPGLTMETRVDVDPIYSGSQEVGSYTHSAQYQLSGTSITGMYFSPYMGDPSSTAVETAPEALAALNSVLTRMSKAVGGRRLFIYEYEFVSNSPQVSDDPALTPGQIPEFLAQSEPLLHRYTAGYALWTYQDYDLSPLYNQSFALGSSGWELTGGAHAVASSGTTSYVALGPGAAATQPLPAGTVDGSTPATVSLQADARTPTTLDVTWGDGTSHVVNVSQGWHDYQVTLPPSAVDSLTIRATGAVSVTDVQMYWFTQLGDVYSTSGTPEVGEAPLRAVNEQLTNTKG
jgi:hypothetical protein